jgi:polyketide cyclase/dehydrase/lipid transport protein
MAMIRFLLRLTVLGGAFCWIAERVLAERRGRRPADPIRSTIAIDAPIERVWKVLTDVEGQPRWMDDMNSVRVLTAPPIGVGTRAEGKIRIFGIGVLDPITITAFEPPHRFAVGHEGQFRGEGLVELESGVDGNTTIARWEETIIPPYLPHLGGIVLTPILRLVFQRDLANLRELVESGAGGS